MKEKLNQFKAEFAKEIFKKADEGAISKEVALDLLTVSLLANLPNHVNGKHLNVYSFNSKMPVVSEERIREELIKCFRCNTIRTLTYLDYLPRLRDYIFNKTNLWLKPTNEK